MSGDRSVEPRRMSGLRSAALAATVLLGLGGLSGCGDIEDQSLCRVYEDYRAQQAVVQDIDLDATSAAEAAEVAEDYLESVRRLQEVVDTRYSAELATLETAASDVLRTLESVPGDTDHATWAPLVEDSLEDAADAAVTVEDRLETQCPDVGDEG